MIHRFTVAAICMILAFPLVGLGQTEPVVPVPDAPAPEKSLNEMTAEELQSELTQLDEAVRGAALRIQELKQELRQDKRKARESDPDVVAMRARMDELRRAMEEHIDTLPEIQELQSELDGLKTGLFDQMKLKTRIQLLIREKREQAAKESTGE